MKTFRFLSRILVACLMLVINNGRLMAQMTTNIKAGTDVVGRSTVRVSVKAGNFVNNGTYLDTTGAFNVLGGTTFSGTGTTSMSNISVNNTGSSVFNSLVSVYNTATLAAGNVNANNDLYIRSDVHSFANLVISSAVLTNNVQGLIATATVASGACPSFTSVLSVNVSGSVALYQWQSSADSSAWNNITGATTASYTASVTATTYYRCNLTTSNSSFAESTPGVKLTMTGSVPGAINGTFAVCQGTTTTLTNAVSGGTWSSTATSVATVGSTTGTVSGVAAGTTTISYTNSCGTATQVVTVNPTPGTIGGTFTVCESSTTTLTNSTTGGTWSSAATSVATVNSSGIVSGVAAGTSTISYSTGCGTPATQVVTVNPLATPGAIIGTTVTCAGSGTTLTATGTSGGLWSSTNTSVATVGSTGSSTTANGVSAGTTTISYTVTNGCGSVAATVTYSVMPLSVAGTISGTTTLCATSTTTLTISGNNYSGFWTSGSTSIATINSSGVVFGVTGGTANISYTVNTCGTARATQVVTVTPLPGTMSGTAILCQGSTTSLSNSVSGGTWSSGNTGVATVDASGNVSGVSGGTSTISYSTGCGSPATMAVSVTPVPATITGTFGICPGGSTTLGNTAAGGAWSSGNTSVATIVAATGLLNGVAAGTSIITYTTGCGTDATQTITVNAVPGIIGGTFTICEGTTTSLANSVAGGTWSSSNTSIATIGSGTGTMGGVAGGTATITYSTGCGTNATQAVSVTPTPGTIGGTFTICQGSTTTLTNSASGGTWSSSNTSVASIDPSTGILSGVSGGTATITYGTGCGSNATQAVSVTPTPGTIGGTFTECQGSTTTLTNSASGGTWSSSNTSVATMGLTSGVMTGVSGGTTTITYSTGCGTNATQAVSVTPTPGSIGGIFTICQGSTTTLTNSASGGTWSSSNTSVASIDPTSGILSGVSGGTATITYSTGCGTNATQAVSVTPTPGSIGGTFTICQGSTTTLTNSASGGTWTSSNTGVASIDPASGIVSGVAGGTATITYGTGCGTNATQAVSVTPTPGTIGGTFTICQGSTTTLTNSALGGTWSSSNTSVASIDPASGIVSGVSGGTTTITYGTGCGSNATQAVSVTPTPGSIGGAFTVCQGSTTTLTNSASGGNWSSSNTSVASIDPASGILGGVSGGTATITYSTGCGSNATQVVSVTPTPGSIGGTFTICQGSTTTLTNTALGGTWSSSNTGVASIDPASGIVSGVSGGTATITYSIGCGTNATQAVSVTPTPGSIGGTFTVCQGSTTTLTNSASGGTWSSSNTGVASIDPSSGLMSGVSGGITTITYSTGCGTDATQAVSVTPLPTAVSGTPVVCAGSATTLSDAISNGTWSSSDITVAMVGSGTGIVSGVGAGTATITYSNGCGTGATVVFTVNPLPSAISGTMNVCISSVTTLSDPDAGGTWAGSDNTIASVDASLGSVTGVTAGTITVTYTLPTGCIATASFTVNPLPSGISGTANVCQGLTVMLSDATAGGTWSSSDNSIATAVAASGVITGVSAGTVNITYTLSTGCYTNSAFTVNPLPSTITGTASVCAGSVTNLTDVTTGGAWSSGNTSVATVSSSGSVGGVSAGTAGITYMLPTGCIAALTATVNPLPSAISGSLIVAKGLTSNLSDALAGGTWVSSNTAVATIGTDGVATGVNAGTTDITYTLPTGCTAYVTMTVTIFSGRMTICDSTTSTLSYYISGGTWSSSNPAVASIGSSSGIVTALSVGTATITYVVGAITETALFTVFASPGTPTVTSVSPLSGNPLTSVAITGTNFNPAASNNIVFFGATQASVVSATTTSLTVTVPYGSLYNFVTVENSGCGVEAFSQYPYLPTFDNSNFIPGTVNFAAKVDLTSGTQPYGVAIGDIDGDGKPDLAVANVSSNTLSLYRNVSTTGGITSGSFASKVDFTTGTQPYAVVIADLDGDGKLDVAVSNLSSNTISVFRNTAIIGSINSSSLAAKVDFATGTNPIHIAVGDIDGDGKPDLVAANVYAPYGISVLRNTSISGVINTSSFAPKVNFTSATQPYCVAIGDLDGDGKPDIAVANQGSNSVSVFRNTATSGSITGSSLAPKVDFTAGNQPLSVAIGDIDGDGKPDLSVANNLGNTVSVFRNTATSGSITSGSFASRIDFTTGSGPWSVALGDFDGDGKVDIAVTNATSNTVSVLRNTATSGSISTGSLAAKVDFITGTSPKLMAVGDLDADGIPEITVADLGSASISIIRNTPFALPPVITSLSAANGNPGNSVTITGQHFNTTAASNIVYFGATQAAVTAASSTSLTVTIPVGATYAPIAVTNAAYAVTGYSMPIFEPTYNNSAYVANTVNFSSKVDFTTGTNPYYVAIGDIDGDGKPDLVAANVSATSISVYRNTATSGTITSGSFAAKVDFTTGTSPYCVAVRDVDGDGKPDVVVANNGSSSVSVLRNTASSGVINSASLAAKVDFTTGTNPMSVAVADIDGDGKPELIVANNNSNTVSLFQNKTVSGGINSTSFGAKIDFTTGTHPYSVATGDIDGDGKIDIVVANQSSTTVSVLRNTSTIGTITASSLAAKVDFTTGASPFNVAIGDVDGDGKLDVVVVNNTGNSVSVFRNTATSGTITTSSLAGRVDFTVGTGPYGVSLGDIDGDGKPDLLVANATSNTVSVLRNTASAGSITSSSLAAKVDYATGTSPHFVAVGDLDGDAKPDLAVAALTANTISVLRNNPLQPISGIPAVCGIGSTTTLSDAVGGGTWSSGNTAIATIGSSSGIVTAVAVGTASITYKLIGGIATTTFTVSVVSPISGIGTVCSGSTLSLTDGGGGTWSSANTSVATVASASGVVAGVSTGTSTITYSLFAGCYTTAVVTVNASPGPISGSTSICAGSVVTLSDATAGGVWSSSNSAVAAVATGSGVVTGISAGTANISYTVGSSCSVFVTVTVSGPPVISSISVLQGIPASSLTISGNSFNTTVSNNIVYFGATMATVTSASYTSLTVNVPYGATFEPITVENSGCSLVAYAQYPFLPEYDNSPFIAGSVNFASKVDFASGGSSFDVAIGDIDGDGYPDIVTTNYSANTISVLRNTASAGAITSASFAAKVDFVTGFEPYGIAIGDIDRDGKLDVVVTNNGSATVSVFRNTATSGSINSSSLAAKVDFATGDGPINVTIGDVDKDGKPDLVVVDYAANTISVLHNVGASGSMTSASFDPKIDFSTGLHPFSAALGDIDGDGKQDVIVANEGSSTVSVLRNTSLVDTVSLAAKVDFATGSNPFYAAVGDIDGDGRMDIVTANNGANSFSVLRNAGGGGITGSTFAPRADYATPAGPYCVALGDVDGDGKLDVAIAAASANKVSVFRNTVTSVPLTVSSFASGVDVTTGTAPRFVALADVNSDSIPDLVVANFVSNTVSVLQNTPVLHPAPHAGTTNEPANVCVGSSVGLTATTPGGKWSSSNSSIASVDQSTGVVTGVAVGRATMTYLLSGAKGNTEAYTPVVVGAAPQGISIAASPGTTVTQGQRVTFTAAVPGDNGSPLYQWMQSGKAIKGAILSTYTAAVADGEVITCTAGSQGCPETVTSNAIVITVLPAGNFSAFNADLLKVIPNPTKGAFFIRGSLGVANDEDVSLEITDVAGRVVYEEKFVARGGHVNELVSLSGVAGGTYLLHLQYSSGNQVFHLVVEQ